VLQESYEDGSDLVRVLRSIDEVEDYCNVFSTKPDDFIKVCFDDNLIKKLRQGLVHYKCVISDETGEIVLGPIKTGEPYGDKPMPRVGYDVGAVTAAHSAAFGQKTVTWYGWADSEKQAINETKRALGYFRTAYKNTKKKFVINDLIGS